MSIKAKGSRAHALKKLAEEFNDNPVRNAARMLRLGGTLTDDQIDTLVKRKGYGWTQWFLRNLGIDTDLSPLDAGEEPETKFV